MSLTKHNLCIHFLHVHFVDGRKVFLNVALVHPFGERRGGGGWRHAGKVSVRDSHGDKQALPVLQAKIIPQSKDGHGM